MYHARRNFATSGVHLSPSLCFIVPRGLTVTHITNFAFKQVRPKASSIRTFCCRCWQQENAAMAFARSTASGMRSTA